MTLYVIFLSVGKKKTYKMLVCLFACLVGWLVDFGLITIYSGKSSQFFHMHAVKPI